MAKEAQVILLPLQFTIAAIYGLGHSDKFRRDAHRLRITAPESSCRARDAIIQYILAHGTYIHPTFALWRKSPMSVTGSALDGALSEAHHLCGQKGPSEFLSSTTGSEICSRNICYQWR